MKIKLSNYLADRLVTAGISQVFSVTGGGAMHLNDALGHQKGLTCLYNHHEQACAMAAEAYARIHNKIAAVCVTTGPGGTNAITGVLGGWLDSIPMMILSGQVRYDTTARWSGVGIRAMGDQEFDIQKSIDCMTKYSEMVIDPRRIRFCFEKALYLAYAGRPGPVWLDLPLDVQGAYIETEDLIGFDHVDYEAGGTGWAQPSDAELEIDKVGSGELRQALPPLITKETARAVIDKLCSAQHPVINAGNGIRIAGAFDVFSRVVRKLGVPVVTGWNSQDCMCSTDALYVGRAGGMGDRAGNFAVQNSDALLSVGSRLSIRQVGYHYKTWARDAYVMVNDIDIEEIKKPSLHVDLPLHGDAKDLLEQMERVLEEEPSLRFGGGKGLDDTSWIQTCQMWRQKYPVVLPEHEAHGDNEPVNVYALVKELSECLLENQITVVGNGSACVVGGHAYTIKKGQRFISNSAVASMGYDLPAAIGICMAEPDMDTILLTGDGSLQMNLQELQTIIHHQLPIKLFLINNGGYHSIRQTQRNFFGEPLVGIGVDSYDLSFPKMEKIAEAYGYPYVSALHNSELSSAIKETLSKKGPAICEVFVSMDQNFEPKSAAKRLKDGTMVSPPLEDLSPFLPDEEMDHNMLISRIEE